jgi:hypothetical protein
MAAEIPADSMNVTIVDGLSLNLAVERSVYFRSDVCQSAPAFSGQGVPGYCVPRLFEAWVTVCCQFDHKL